MKTTQHTPHGTPPLSAGSRALLLRAALACSLSTSFSHAQVAVAEKLFVDLRASQASAGSGNWSNLGISGNFSVLSGSPLKQNLGGVDYVSMDPATQYVGPSAPSSIAGASTRSVEVWAKNDTVDNEDIMIAWGMRGAEGRNYAFTYGSNPTWGALGAWGAPDLGWSTVPAVATLHHLVATYDGTTTRVYSDGVLVSSEAAPLDTYDVPNNFILNGAREGDNVAIQRPNVGNLDYAVIRVHDGVLSDAQILANFTAGVTALPGDTDADGLPDFWEDHYLLGANDNGSVNPAFGAAGDPDGDSASNLAEYQGGTDPQNGASSPTDSDADGLPDAWELSNLGSLLYDGDDDPDGDFDFNVDELTANKNPLDRTSHIDNDTPPDQMSDAWEMAYFSGTDRVGEGDEDEDAVSNLQEFLRDTSPIDPASTGEPDGDADGDGLDDTWERTYFTTVLVKDADDDGDSDGSDNLAEYQVGSDPTLASSTPADVNGDGIPDVVFQLSFNAAGSGGLLDADGESTGFNTRLAGTGTALPVPNDTNLNLNTTTGILEMTSTTADFNGQGGIDMAETPGIPLSQLGFTGGQDFTVRAKFIDLPVFDGYDQVGVFAGGDSAHVVRGGLLFFEHEDELKGFGVNNNGGGDSDLVVSPATSVASGPGLSMTVELSRMAGVWSLKVNGTNFTPGVDPDFLDALPDLTVGVFHADVISGPQTVKLESFTVVRFGGANPDGDGDGMDDSWETTHFGNTDQGAAGDFDNDGTENLAEFRLGLLPANGSSRFVATADAGGMLQWPSKAGVTFKIERSATLASGSWATLEAAYPAAAAPAPSTSYTDPGAPAGRAFYRITLNP
jgi:hypothetical protein